MSGDLTLHSLIQALINMAMARFVVFMFDAVAPLAMRARAAVAVF